MKRGTFRLLWQVHLNPIVMICLTPCLVLAAAGCGMPGTISSGGRLPPPSARSTPPPLPPVHFPQDEAPHHNLTEWWYYTGHLNAVDRAGTLHVYGFELTFFQTLRGQFSPYYAAHFAVSDINHGQFHFDQRALFEPPAVVPPTGSTMGFDLAVGGWSARGLEGRDHLAAAMDGYAIALDLTTEKPPVLHGGDGIISYGPAGYSYYYSRTRMQVRGALDDHGTRLTVNGLAWMDHQWGDFVSLAGSGWDWYSIQLNDNTEYMLYVIRDEQKQPISTFGTAVAPDGKATAIAPDALRFETLDTWRSPHTGGVYPSGWRIVVTSGQLVLTLTPQLHDQELVTTASTGVAYWEGSVDVQSRGGSSAIAGTGYVELTGYAGVPPRNTGSSFP